MVKKKDALSRVDALRAMQEEWDKNNPVVQTRWSVEEVTPGYNTGGYYDQDIKETFTRVSDLLDTKEEAEAWIDEHEADEGKYLAIRKHVARQHTYTNWVSVRVSS